MTTRLYLDCHIGDCEAKRRQLDAELREIEATLAYLRQQRDALDEKESAGTYQHKMMLARR